MPSESPNATSLANRVAFDRIVEQDHQFRLGLQLVAQRFERVEFRPSARTLCVAVLIFAHRARRDGVNVRLVMAEVGANLEREERMLQREIGADDQERLAVVEIGRWWRAARSCR